MALTPTAATSAAALLGVLAGCFLPLPIHRLSTDPTIEAQPARGPTTLGIRYQDPGGTIHDLGHFRTDAGGVLTLEEPFQPGRRWQVQWTDPQGRTYDGPLTPAYAFGLPAG